MDEMDEKMDMDIWDKLYYDDDEEDFYVETFSQTYEFCMKPTLIEVIPYVWKLFICNLIYRVIVKTFTIPKKLCHIASIISGMVILFLLLRTALLYITFFITFCCVVLYISRWIFGKYSVYVISFVYITYLIGSEFFYPEFSIWIETRGLHMVVTMKFISILFDVRNEELKKMPDFIEIMGYILCPSNSILGPWISYSAYKSLYEERMSIWDLSWLKHFSVSIVLAIFFLTVSNCWASWIIPSTFKWTVAYQEALAFRSSSYFISYLSQAVLLTAGFGHDSKTNKKLPSDNCAVSKPTLIEFPRSLVQVVIYWNMPMHLWLKTYVFRVTKPMGSFFAVIMTYLVSSFLHGCNLKLAAVLLSLGFYTYVEYKFRHKLSHIFNACIGANPCKKCDHKYRTDIYTRCTNILFSLLAVFHLAYLGCLMESDSEQYQNDHDPFLKWRELGYASHIVTAVIYVIYKLV